MPKFYFWTADEIKQAIVDLEGSMAAGMSSISIQGGGQTQNVPYASMIRVLDHLYTAWQEKSGQRIEAPRRVGMIRVLPRGY